LISGQKKIVWTHDGEEDDDIGEADIHHVQDGHWNNDRRNNSWEHERIAIAKRVNPLPRNITDKRPPVKFGMEVGGGLHKNLSEIIELSKKEQSGFVPYKVYNLKGSYSDQYLNKMNSKIKKHFNLFGGFKKVSKEVVGNLSDLDNLLRLDLQNQVMNSVNKKYYKSYNVTNQTGGGGSKQVHTLWQAFVNASESERQVFDCIAIFMYRDTVDGTWREVDINNVPSLKRDSELRVNLKKFMGSSYPDKTTRYLQRYFHEHWQNNVINLLLMLPPRYRDFQMMATNYWLGISVDTAPAVRGITTRYDDEGSSEVHGPGHDYEEGSNFRIGVTKLPEDAWDIDVGEGKVKHIDKAVIPGELQVIVPREFNQSYGAMRALLSDSAEDDKIFVQEFFRSLRERVGAEDLPKLLRSVSKLSLGQNQYILVYLTQAQRWYHEHPVEVGEGEGEEADYGALGGAWPVLREHTSSLRHFRSMAGDPKVGEHDDTIDVGADPLARLVNCDDEVVDKLGNIKENDDDDDIFETGFEDDIENQNKMWKVDDEGNYVVIDVRTGKKEEWNIEDKANYKKQFDSSVKCFNSYIEIDKETCCTYIDKLISGDGKAFMKAIGDGTVTFEDLQKDFKKQNPFTIKQILKSFKWEKIQTWDPIYKGKVYKYPNFDHWVKNVLENEPDSELSRTEKDNIKNNKELKDILNMCVAFVNHNVQLLNPHLEPFEGSPVEIPELKERGVIFYVPQTYNGPQVDWVETQRKILKPYQKFSRNNSLWSVPIFSGDSFMFGGGNQSEQVVLTRTPVAPGFSNEVHREIKIVLDRLKEVNKVLKKDDIKKIQTHLDEFKNLEIKLMKKILTINKYIKVAYALNDNQNEVVSLNSIRQKITDAEDSLNLFQDKDLELKNISSYLSQLLKDNKL